MIIVFHKRFKKKYNRLPTKLRDKCDERILLFDRDPRNSSLENHPLGGDRLGQWSINITGDYRALYEFSNANSVVFVDIDTHNKLYKK